MASGAEFTYQTSATSLQMASGIYGDGVAVTGASYSGPTNSMAIYPNGQPSPGFVPSTMGVILSTGDAADFTQSNTPAARRILRGFEAQVLCAGDRAA